MLIYIITNDINDKVYIGQTTKSLEARIANHHNSFVSGAHTHIYNAMRKYGWDKFHFAVLATAKTQEELDALEAEYIIKYDSIRNGYNMIPGGRVNPMDSSIVKAKHKQVMQTEAVRSKISKTMKESIAAHGGVSAAVRAKQSEVRKKLYASPEGELVKQKFRESFQFSPEHYKALNEAKYKAVYCINESGDLVAEFNCVTAAAQWWYDQGYKLSSIDSIMDRIKLSSKENRYIKGLKWIYRV